MPEGLALDGYWRDYGGAPWNGEVSSGSSSSHKARAASVPPGVLPTTTPKVGAPLQGHPTLDANGVRDELTPDGTLADYSLPSSMSGWVLFKARSTTAWTEQPAHAPAFFGDDNGLTGVTLSGAGFGLFRFTSYVGWKGVTVATPLNEWHLGTFRWSAAAKKLDVGLDGPPTSSTYATRYDFETDRPLHMFRNHEFTAFLDAAVAEQAITKSELTDAAFSSVVSDLNDRYGLQLQSKSNLAAGVYPGCIAPTDKAYFPTQATQLATYRVRDGAKLHFFKGKYWLLGGWAPGGYEEWSYDSTTNEIWSSVDLAEWKLERPHVQDPPTTGPNARWRGRHTFGSAIMNGYLWVVGSDLFDGCRADVWRSSDGVTWERLLAQGPWYRKRAPIVGAYEGALHVIGGEIDEPPALGPSTSQHYRSTDGVHWEQLPDAPFVRSRVYQAVEHCGKLLVVGGDAGTSAVPIPMNDTWAWDGATWRQQSASAPWSPRFWNGVAVYDGKLWATSGRSAPTLQSPDGDVGGAWYSTDAGQTWREVDSFFPGTHADGLEASATDGLVMASGNKIQRTVVRLTATTSDLGPPIQIELPSTSVERLSSVSLKASGGSGEGFVWSLVSGSAGAQVDATTGVYTAGSKVGTVEVVRVVDSRGNAARASVTVLSAPVVITPNPATVAAGSSLAFEWKGGDGERLTWSFERNSSGGTLDEKTGVYVAGSVSGVDDVLIARDAAGTQTTVTVTVTKATTSVVDAGETSPSDSGSTPSTSSTSGGITSCDATDAGGVAPAAVPDDRGAREPPPTHNAPVPAADGGCSLVSAKGSSTPGPLAGLVLASLVIVVRRARRATLADARRAP